MDVRVLSTSNGDAVDFGLLKVHCRVRHDMDDALLRTYLKASVIQFEEHCSRKVLNTGLEVQLCRFPCNKPVVLPYPPFQTLNSITYLDTDDESQTLTGVTTRTGEIFTQLNVPTDDWPDVSTQGNGDEVKINITAGYGHDYNSVPHDLQVSLMVLVGLWYEDREIGDVPDGVKNLWGPYVTEPIV